MRCWMRTAADSKLRRTYSPFDWVHSGATESTAQSCGVFFILFFFINAPDKNRSYKRGGREDFVTWEWDDAGDCCKCKS